MSTASAVAMSLRAHDSQCADCRYVNRFADRCEAGKAILTAGRQGKVSLAKVPSDQPSEWELDRRRTMINPTVATLTGHREGLAANDPFSLNSALNILASIHPRSHRMNRALMGVDVFGR